MIVQEMTITMYEYEYNSPYRYKVTIKKKNHF